MAHTNDWTWPRIPTDPAAVDAMLSSVDEYLARRNSMPHQRPMQAKVIVSKAFGFNAPLFDLSWQNRQITPNDPAALLEQIDTWYQQNYGERLQFPFPARSFVLNLRSTLWRVRLPIIYGTVRLTVDIHLDTLHEGASFNLLHGIDDFTQAYASRLREDEICALLQTSKTAFKAVRFLNNLPASGSALAEQARLDYEHSVDALMSGFAWSKACWETAQCAEKTIKCLLSSQGHNDYPRGADGHNIPKLGLLLEEKTGITTDQGPCVIIDCKPGVRYGEEPVTPENAYQAHTSLLGLLAKLGGTMQPMNTSAT